MSKPAATCTSLSLLKTKLEKLASTFGDLNKYKVLEIQNHKESNINLWKRKFFILDELLLSKWVLHSKCKASGVYWMVL